MFKEASRVKESQKESKRVKKSSSRICKCKSCHVETIMLIVLNKGGEEI